MNEIAEGTTVSVEGGDHYVSRAAQKLLAGLDGGDAKARIPGALETVELTDRAKDRVGGYSHGMRQRLGIAGALIREPRLLLLDEPTTGLDPAGMRDMRLLVRRLADGGMTVLLSSHLMDEVEELCDRVAILHQGELKAEGRVKELIEQHQCNLEQVFLRVIGFEV